MELILTLSCVWNICVTVAFFFLGQHSERQDLQIKELKRKLKNIKDLVKKI